MKQKTINLYKFEELTEEQQAIVLDKYRDFNADIFESYVDDECNTLEIIESGFNNPKIKYDLSYSQGSGACFDCDEFDFDLLLKDWQHKHKQWIINIIKSHCQGYIRTNLYSCRYSHSKTRYFELIEDNVMLYHDCLHIDNVINLAEQYIEALRLKLSENLTNRLYEQLEWLQNDEQIKDTLITNEYYFNGETLEIEY